jgi:Zn-dependent peptidase ImmA (M78 family)
VVERVDVNPELITWARRRSRQSAATLRRRFAKLDEWEQGARAPTRKQLEAYARATHVSVEWLLLDAPPEERVPIPDGRAIARAGARRPTPDLLDTIQQCRRRQTWYRRFARASRERAVDFVGSMSLDTDVVDAAAAMRTALHFELDERRAAFGQAPAKLAEAAEENGVLVMVNGVVGSNTRRKLDPSEFRGFALVDRDAPVVFVNGVDLKPAQVFTLAHELAHVWLGETALCDADLSARPAARAERWCSAVAAELLVPAEPLEEQLDRGRDVIEESQRLAKRFKVSPLVMLRRMRDVGRLDEYRFERAYEAETARLREQRAARKSGGGNFYNTQPVRVSKRFARALLASTLEGRTRDTEAFEMLGFRREATLRRLAERLGVG